MDATAPTTTVFFPTWYWLSSLVLVHISESHMRVGFLSLEDAPFYLLKWGSFGRALPSWLHVYLQQLLNSDIMFKQRDCLSKPYPPSHRDMNIFPKQSHGEWWPCLIRVNVRYRFSRRAEQTCNGIAKTVGPCSPTFALTLNNTLFQVRFPRSKQRRNETEYNNLLLEAPTWLKTYV